MEKRISIIGGDLRIIKLINMMIDDGFKVYSYGIELAEDIDRVIHCNTVEEAISNSDVVIGPIPFTTNMQDVNMPFSNNKVEINQLIDLLEGKTFIAGSIRKEIYALGEGKNINFIDLLDREELTVLNAISTAEGAIQIAMEETEITLHGSNILVLGFGRVGKILAKMLDGIGAKVDCEARRDEPLAWIKAYGYNPVRLEDIDKNLGKYDTIINTVPSILLDEERLKLLKKQCLIIDLASTPGGVDKKAAKELGIKLVWALSLPGKVAPATSAEYIKETVYNIINEMKKQ